MKKYQILILVVFILVTATVISAKPQLHKKVVFEDTEVLVNNNSIDKMPKEEQIVWNKWKSDITNRIMKTTKISEDEEPMGTVNKVEFKVDRNRNITNINVTTEPEKYTTIARKRFFESINQLNGDSILDFPKDSQRKIMTFNDYFQTDNKTKYTTPKDYKDYETIKR